MIINKECEAKIIYLLQRGLPIEQAPFAVLAEQLGDISENQIIGFVKKNLAEKKARCLRGIFNLQLLGYKSILCAATIPKEELDSVGSKLVQDKAITHCYERSYQEKSSLMPDTKMASGRFPNLWFTYTMKEEEYDETTNNLRDILSPHPVYLLPATTQFKIQVIFDTRKEEDKSNDPGVLPQQIVTREKQMFSLREKDLIRSLANIAITSEPYADIARQCSMSHDEVLKILRIWQRKGILRRIGLIMYHRRIGFSANGMAVWQIPPEKVQRIGKQLAKLNEVTHCYERHAVQEFPFTFYAMIHAENWNVLNRLFEDISHKFSLDNGQLFRSEHEYKKTSFQPFSN